MFFFLSVYSVCCPCSSMCPRFDVFLVAVMSVKKCRSSFSMPTQQITTEQNDMVFCVVLQRLSICDLLFQVKHTLAQGRSSHEVLCFDLDFPSPLTR